MKSLKDHLQQVAREFRKEFDLINVKRVTRFEDAPFVNEDVLAFLSASIRKAVEEVVGEVIGGDEVFTPITYSYHDMGEDVATDVRNTLRDQQRDRLKVILGK